MIIRINKFSKAPLYKQIKTSILDSIKNKEYRHLDLLPTEKDICDAYLLSRSVVRRAYDELIKEGYVERRQGHGTYVTNRYIFIGSNKEIFRFNYLPFKEIVHLGDLDFHQQAYPLLGLKQGDMCYDVTIRLTIDDDPVSIQRLFFPKHLYPDLEKHMHKAEDLKLFIEKRYQHPISGIYSDFIATTCSPTESMLLNIPHKSAVHYVTSIVKDDMEKVIAVIFHTLPGDYVKFEEVVK